MFRNLHLNHPQPVHVPWLPVQPHEPLADYVRRLMAQIPHSKEPPTLVGLSFGGIVAQEVAKQIPVRQVILISSLARRRDLPWYSRAAGTLQMHRWLPFTVLRRWYPPAEWAFGAKTSEDKKLLRTIIRETDLTFLRWALHQILTWPQSEPANNCIFLHGDRDKVLPIPMVPNVHVIPGGEHLMLINQSAEVSQIINRFL